MLIEWTWWVFKLNFRPSQSLLNKHSRMRSIVTLDDRLADRQTSNISQAEWQKGKQCLSPQVIKDHQLALVVCPVTLDNT